MLPKNQSALNIINVKQTEMPSKTWYVDNNKLKLNKSIDGLNAVVQSAYLTLQTDRYTHIIFSWQYGSELQTLLGKDEAFVFSEAKRMITDALSTDTRITDIKDFKWNNGIVSFVIETIFGSEKLTVGVTKR